jgi:hypothetical protein
MHLWHRLALAALLSSSACQTAQPSRPTAASGPPAASTASSTVAPTAGSVPDFLVRRSTFTGCELEGFVSLTAARNALVFGAKKESLLGARGNGPWQRAMIDDLFARMKVHGLRSHGSFAAEKFYQCADRQRLALTKNAAGAAACLARLDIVFYMDADRRKGRTQGETLAHFKRNFAHVPKDVFPEALVEQLAPMVFRISSDDGEYELRRFVFETCLFPDEWKQWWESAGRKEDPGRRSGAPTQSDRHASGVEKAP